MASQIVGNFFEVEAALLAVIPRVEAANEIVEREAAEVIVGLAEARAPELTGHLKASITENGGEVIADTDYAGYVEYGTRRSKAQPFLRPAKDASEPIVKALAETAYTVATR